MNSVPRGPSRPRRAGLAECVLPGERGANSAFGARPITAGLRSAGDTSASAAAGTTKEFSSSFSSSLISSGYRRPGSTVTAKSGSSGIGHRWLRRARLFCCAQGDKRARNSTRARLSASFAFKSSAS